jgi:hypothetical protein
MDAVMKQANIIPWGIFSLLGLRAGVQRKTNVYMEASNRDCMAPKSPILVSAWHTIGVRVTSDRSTQTLTSHDGGSSHLELLNDPVVVLVVAIVLSPGGDDNGTSDKEDRGRGIKRGHRA